MHGMPLRHSLYCWLGMKSYKFAAKSDHSRVAAGLMLLRFSFLYPRPSPELDICAVASAGAEGSFAQRRMRHEKAIGSDLHVEPADFAQPVGSRHNEAGHDEVG